VVLRGIIEKYKDDFDVSHFDHFKAGSSELSMLKNSIFNHVKLVNRNVALIEGLQQMQVAIGEKQSEEEFHLKTLQILQELFKISIVDEPQDSLYSLVSTNQTYCLKSSSLINRNEIKPFLEQYQYYFLQDELKSKYLQSMVQKKEFELAEEAQKDLMPRNDLSNKNICSFYKAARFLGGDFYDNFATSNQDYYIIADVSGKGLAASLYGLLVKSYLMSLMHNTDSKTDVLLAKLNDYLIKQNKSDFFCTLFLAKYDQNTKLLEYASAGHNKMIMLKEDDLVFLSTKGLPIGMMDMNLYESKTCEVNQGNLLFLYTSIWCTFPRIGSCNCLVQITLPILLIK
ncbi:SpoIIE family protein phosphatase, partial [bacterium]|nr:SpoIIE family protein phosphatase [bacterium]